jgi:transposase
MGNPKGVARDFDELERRRLAAVRLFEKAELNNSQIGRRLQVTNQTVSRWRKQFQAGGGQALRKAGRAGRKPRLEADQFDRLVDLLKQGPEKQGYETPLWTCRRVRHLVKREFGVEYHAGHVWKILRELNWSPQRPVGRALERNEHAIEDWKKVRWPALKKKRRKRVGKSSSSTKAG